MEDQKMVKLKFHVGTGAAGVPLGSSPSAFMLRMPDFLLVLAVVKLRFMYSSIRNRLGINCMLGVDITGMVLCC